MHNLEQLIATRLPVCNLQLSTTNHQPKWNPVLELHQPLRFCKPPPELLGQRDVDDRMMSGRMVLPVRNRYHTRFKN